MSYVCFGPFYKQNLTEYSLLYLAFFAQHIGEIPLHYCMDQKFVPFFFFAEYCSIVWTGHGLLIHAPVE